MLTAAKPSRQRRVNAKRGRNSAALGAVLLGMVTVGAGANAQRLLAQPGATASESTLTCERWGVAEIVLRGPTGGNPFLDVELSATFERDGQQQRVPGFYDGAGS